MNTFFYVILVVGILLNIIAVALLAWEMIELGAIDDAGNSMVLVF